MKQLDHPSDYVQYAKFKLQVHSVNNLHVEKSKCICSFVYSAFNRLNLLINQNKNTASSDYTIKLN